MKEFSFKQFAVSQDEKVFRVGTDAVLLGALSHVNESKEALEIGSGTGIISLMLAQRNQKVEITAIDINEKAAELTATNFQNSPFASRLNSFCFDLNGFHPDRKFDLIVCNPPYFELTPQSDRDAAARQKIHLDFPQLIEFSSVNLTDEGLLSVIIPADMAQEFESSALQFQLNLITKITIYGRIDLNPTRVILEFNKTLKKPINSDFIIEKSPRVFSDEYLEVTKDFHVFGGK